jgi:hypothetical protein
MISAEKRRKPSRRKHKKKDEPASSFFFFLVFIDAVFDFQESIEHADTFHNITCCEQHADYGHESPASSIYGIDCQPDEEDGENEADDYLN